MKKHIFRNSLFASFAIILAATVTPLTVSAEDRSTETVTTTQTAEQREAARKSAQERLEAARAKTQERREAVKTRLQDAKLRVCENRQKSITNIMKRIGDRGQKHLDLFSTIAERTQKFYEEKGKVLANYDALVANVEAKKSEAQAAVDTIKSTSTAFDCGADDPKGIVSSFKESLRLEIDALKAYKTSVKNLIVGVKSVQSTSLSEGDQD